MVQMKSTVTINTGLIKKLTAAAATALEKTGEALHTEVVQAQVMPRDTGALQNEKTFVDYADSRNGLVRIISEGPYARRLYYHPEYNFQKHENPYAGGEWFKPWLPGGANEDFARDAFRRFYKGEAGI